ncbi:aspartate/glutamate racemase family protein [Sinomonas sp. JGH33]|uniref:Aspartate/glutamate racemase family protein n=1 Tax=Sinomonas terricola TaxID=3110330 RepID=A0ABU5TBE5_9MICC|nr:aspartate/glutamate racemase family protein [Sinomonas sp. JGH33]MEA5457012.1 aspartate/glutamate racemase family protein [Sinomonas sp. JGH33]
MTVAFVHTVGFLVDAFKARMTAELPDVPAFHILNESLLQDLLSGKPKADVHSRVADQILLACEAGADLVVMTCSSTSPGVDLARARTQVPILKIDDPMAAAAVAAGSDITLVCTAASTVEPSSDLLRAHAGSKEIDISVLLLSDAYEAILAGDRDRHDALVTSAVAEAAAATDAVVLAQASLAHLQESLEPRTSTPILASPPLLMAELRRRLGRKDHIAEGRVPA